MSREAVLGSIRKALGRTAGQAPPPVPPAVISVPDVPMERRIERFFHCIEALAGKTFLAESVAEAKRYVSSLIEGKTAVVSNSTILKEWGIAELPNVKGSRDAAEWRRLCATCDVGISSADYALSDTGTLVAMASTEEGRLMSLLPPLHIAIVPRERILTGLDELLTLEPLPSEKTCAMVLITGPSRTADIEQILVRGVHGPGEIHVVVV